MSAETLRPGLPIRTDTPKGLLPAQIQWLEGLGLHYNLPEPAIICTHCGFALKADGDRVSRHLGEKHDVSKRARRGLSSLIQSLQLPKPDLLPPRADGSGAHPHLALKIGANCKHCKLRSTSLNQDKECCCIVGDMLAGDSPRRTRHVRQVEIARRDQPL